MTYRHVKRLVPALAGAAAMLAAPALQAVVIRGATATNIRRPAVVNNTVVRRDVNINVDNHWDPYVRHPVAAGVAIGTAAAVTAAAIGSMVHTLPPACATIYRAGIAYYQCGSVWYQPQFVGPQVSYVVVTAP